MLRKLNVLLILFLSEFTSALVNQQEEICTNASVACVIAQIHLYQPLKPPNLVIATFCTVTRSLLSVQGIL